ncbi:MAG: restriction endonuclease [Planctomycetaceae bacterium]|nr:restriction endonuclease [Planctomycetaceae bacterium]
MLIYTGAGRSGDQSVSGPNARITQQQDECFPIYGFMQIGSRRNTAIGSKRWSFLGLIEYLRCYRERQVDSDGMQRNVWIFELRVHSDPADVQVAADQVISRELLNARRTEINGTDREVVPISESDGISQRHLSLLEPIRRRLLGYDPRQFEHVVQDLLRQSGFDQVEVTKYSQDGGIDVNAKPGKFAWPLRQLLVQLQAKRWLHTVGRKEVAELRGSLKPHAAGCIITTSRFSRAAIVESTDAGKVPITLIDGYELAGIVTSLNLNLA